MIRARFARGAHIDNSSVEAGFKQKAIGNFECINIVQGYPKGIVDVAESFYTTPEIQM